MSEQGENQSNNVDQNPGQGFNTSDIDTQKFLSDPNPNEVFKSTEVLKDYTLRLWEPIQYFGKDPTVSYSVVCSLFEQQPEEFKVLMVQNINGLDAIGGITPMSNQPISSTVIPYNSDGKLLDVTTIRQFIENYYSQKQFSDNPIYQKMKSKLLTLIEMYDKGKKERTVTVSEIKKGLDEEKKSEQRYVNTSIQTGSKQKIETQKRTENITENK